MAINISSGALTALVGLSGVLIGSLIGPYINHKLNLKNTRKDIIFKRKLEYFEKLAENIEKNIRIYKNSIYETDSKKSKKDINKIFKKLKQQRINFLIIASPLYFNIHNLSEKITAFVNTEKDIFEEFKKLNRTKNEKDKINITENLKQKLKNLNTLGSSVVLEMKKELHKW